MSVVDTIVLIIVPVFAGGYIAGYWRGRRVEAEWQARWRS